MGAEAPAEEAVMLLRVDDQFVALDLDHRSVEQLLRSLSRNPRIAAGVHGHIVGAGNLDLLETTHLIIARDARSGAFFVNLTARACRGTSGGDCCGDGLAHLIPPSWAVLSAQY